MSLNGFETMPVSVVSYLLFPCIDCESSAVSYGRLRRRLRTRTISISTILWDSFTNKHLFPSRLCRPSMSQKSLTNGSNWIRQLVSECSLHSIMALFESDLFFVLISNNYLEFKGCIIWGLMGVQFIIGSMNISTKRAPI